MSKNTYTVKANCHNCRWEGTQTFEFGVEVNRWRECPQCGCIGTLHFGEAIYTSRNPINPDEKL